MGDPKRKHGNWKGSHVRPSSLQTNKHTPSYRQASCDSIQGRVLREGITARNLIKYNVPLENGAYPDRQGLARMRNPAHSYPSSAPKKSPSAASPRKSSAPSGLHQVRTPRRHRDDRARYWGHMLDTLKRTIDEIYTACEEDESEVECREVILILEHSKKDFHSLIEKMNLLREYENADAQHRPTSLAWDERKTSPGKPLMKQVLLERTLSAAAVKAAAVAASGSPTATLTLTSVSASPVPLPGGVADIVADVPVDGGGGAAVTATLPNGQGLPTWADRVRGSAAKPKASAPVPEFVHLAPPNGCSREGSIASANEVTASVDSRDVASSVAFTEETEEGIDEDDGGGWEKVEKRPRGGSKNRAHSRRTGPAVASPPIKANSQPSYWRGVGTGGLRMRSESCSSNGSNLRRTHSMSENNISSLRAELAGHQQPQQSARASLDRDLPAVVQPLRIVTSNQTAECSVASSGDQECGKEEPLLQTSDLLPKRSQGGYADVLKFGSESGDWAAGGCQAIAEDSENSPEEMKITAKGEERDGQEEETKIEEEEEEEEETKIEEEEGEEDEETKIEEEDEEDAKGKEEEDVEEEQEEEGELEQQRVKRRRKSSADMDDADEAEEEEEEEEQEDEEDEEDKNLTSSRKKEALTLSCEIEEEEEEEEEANGTTPTPYTSIDFTSGEEEEERNLRKLDEELADAEDKESALTTQLESEEKDYYAQVDAAASAIACTAFETPMSWEEIVEEQKKTGGISWDLISSLDPDCLSNIDDDSELAAAAAAVIVSGGGEDKYRTPGRAVQMHERLSSPSRRRSLQSSTLTHIQEKQDKARKLRSRVLGERTDKIRELMHKVEEARAHKDYLLSERKMLLSQRMHRAESKRRAQLERKVRKAHDEETKGREIAFIQSLEQEQKQHNILAKHQESELRLLEIQEERRRKLEEKAEREAAVEGRRRELDESRKARLLELQQRRECREREIANRADEREKCRLAAARDKELVREKKLAAVKAMEQKQIEDLKIKIAKKQEETERRYQEQLREISRKAFEMSVLKASTEDTDDAPALEPYASKKWCSVCQTVIHSEVILQSHLRGKKHMGALRERMPANQCDKAQIERFNLENIVDAPKDEMDQKAAAHSERRRHLRKRMKKLKQRMNARGEEFLKEKGKSNSRGSESVHRTKLAKVVKEVGRYLAIGDNGPWVQRRVMALDKSLGEAIRCLEAKLRNDQVVFNELGGDNLLCSLLKLVDPGKPEQQPVLPDRSFLLTCQLYQAVCEHNWRTSRFALFANRTAHLVDALAFRLDAFITDSFGRDPQTHQLLEASDLPGDPVAVGLMETLEAILTSVATLCPHSGGEKSAREAAPQEGRPEPQPSPEQLSARIQDFVSHVVCLGVPDRLTTFLSNVRGPLGATSPAAAFVKVSLAFLEALLKLMALKHSLDGRKSEPDPSDDPTQLLATVTATELFGLVSLLYGMLLHSGAPSKRDASPQPLAEITQAVTMGGLRLINAMAELSRSTTQLVLGEEGTVLQLRHIVSYLLWYCGRLSSGRCPAPVSEHAWRPLLHEVLLCVGHFTVGHPDNQNCLQSGQPPTALQLLCQLPFDYFSNRRLTRVLYPSLIAACFQNEANSDIVKAELSLSLLANFLEEHIAPSSKAAPVEAAAGDRRLDLANRFPRALWTAAFRFFSS